MTLKKVLDICEKAGLETITFNASMDGSVNIKDDNCDSMILKSFN